MMLTQAVDAYLAIRRAAGFQLINVELILRDYVAFADAAGDAFIRTSTVVVWAAKSCSPRQRFVRLRTVVHLARYLRAEDDHHDLPPVEAFGRHPARRRPPFLFTPADIQTILREARSVGREGELRPHVYSTLLGLLACTGLRISEALNLKLDDVTPDGLIVRGTKFGKTRLLPLHRTVWRQLEDYLERRLRVAGACDYLFVSVRGRKLHKGTIYRVFRRLAEKLDLVPDGGKPGPRVHDLRHHFAIQSLEHCSGDHAGISRHMVALATYLGHSQMKDTYWYLEATPAILSATAARCEDYFETEGSA